MNDAAPGVPHPVKLDAEFSAVFLQLADLCDGQRTGIGQILADGRRDVIRCGQGSLGPADPEAVVSQTCKCLRGSNFVDQMKIDVQDRRRLISWDDNVIVPDLVVECSRVLACHFSQL